MTEQKKDLTGILEYSESLKEAGQLPPAPEGAVMEAPTLEKIDEFESLEQYASQNPVPETPPETEIAPPESITAPESAGDFPLSTEPSEASPVSEFGTSDFPTTPPEENAAQPSDFGALNFDPAASILSSSDSSPSDLELGALPDLAPPDSGEAPISAPVDISPTPAPAILAAVEKPSSPIEPTPPPVPRPTLEKVKSYAEQLPLGKPAVPAAFPFSLLISGHLEDHEKARLIDILSRENMGIREIDLEPQLATGKILIPRISEYAGVVLIQALRSANVKFRFGPSDSIYSTDDTKELPYQNETVEHRNYLMQDDLAQAEQIPVTPATTLPSVKDFKVIDTLTASAVLKSNAVEAENTAEFQDLVEALQRELKYKAHRRGADAIIQFKVDLTVLASPSHYRLLATGIAIDCSTKN